MTPYVSETDLSQDLTHILFVNSGAIEVDLYGGFMPNQIVLLIVWLRFTTYRVRIKENFTVKKRMRMRRNFPAPKFKISTYIYGSCSFLPSNSD